MNDLTIAKKIVLLVGSGKLATHLKFWISLTPQCQFQETLRLMTWDRQHSFADLSTIAQKADRIWLAISDAQIVPFYEKNLAGKLNPNCKVVHFSGALNDPRLVAAHPLMTFGPGLYDKPTYEKIQFGLTGCENLQQALPGFKNSFFPVPTDIKPLYHALCVVAGNFPQMLWKEVRQQCEQKAIPFSAFEVFLETSLRNFLKDPEHALTGPFARKDFSTIEKNMQALDSPLKQIYQTFNKEFLQRTSGK